MGKINVDRHSAAAGRLNTNHSIATQGFENPSTSPNRSGTGVGVRELHRPSSESLVPTYLDDGRVGYSLCLAPQRARQLENSPPLGVAAMLVLGRQHGGTPSIKYTSK